ncbi:hypothetical protein ACJX0J_028570, partial [Zea mays]
YIHVTDERKISLAFDYMCLFGIMYMAVPSLEEDFHALLPAEAKAQGQREGIFLNLKHFLFEHSFEKKCLSTISSWGG